MSAERSTYIPLLDLAVDWAAEAGMPKELVLRRLCEWAMAGAFPKGAFITATGDEISPFDIYLSFRVVTENNGVFGSGGIYLDGWTIYNNNEQWGMHVLAKVLVTASNVCAFTIPTSARSVPTVTIVGTAAGGKGVRKSGAFRGATGAGAHAHFRKSQIFFCSEGGGGVG